jgi:hypothetical protein
LLVDVELCRRLGAAAREKAREQWSVDVAAAGLRAAYDRVLEP